MPLHEMEAIRDAPTPAWSDSKLLDAMVSVPLVAENARELDIYNHSVQWTWADPGDPGNEWRPRDALANPEEEDDEMEEAAEEEGWEEEDPCVDDLVSEKALAILAEGKVGLIRASLWMAVLRCNGNGEPIPRLGKCRSLHLMKA
ncbi:unnamed protein product [Symbiodinium necroappetens]|uniref:Uncharacterized protein n=1 Tax=Symbiodinium necroappetens TaxID=1628268 RepID=A0A813CC08_9DINO|nr:unnamed protein product [Symbiodinium necroappetens]